MLRKFINCMNVEERIECLVNSNAENWTEDELNAVMEIVGVKEDFSKASKSEIISAIATTLGFVKNASMKETVFVNVDEAPDKIGMIELDRNEMLLNYAKAVAVAR